VWVNPNLSKAVMGTAIYFKDRVAVLAPSTFL